MESATKTSGIRCSSLTKQYRTRQRDEGTFAALTSLLKSRYEVVTAVEKVDFSMAPGEMVGLLGGNGAGKTTLLRLLTGVIAPTSGAVSVDGYVPSEHKTAYLRNITLVMGQKSQLNWDIPVVESFRLHQAIYDIDEADYQSRMADFFDILGIEPYLSKPTRSLSLGERMRCEVAKSLLHAPATLFFDEPTIGLDPDVQRQLRAYLRHYCEQRGASLLLTSHNIRDIEELCPRVIALEKGSVIYDGSFRALIEQHRPIGRLDLTIPVEQESLLRDSCMQRGLMCTEIEPGRYTIEIPQADCDSLLRWLSSHVTILAMSRGEPRSEDVVADLYQGSGR